MKTIFICPGDYLQQTVNFFNSYGYPTTSKKGQEYYSKAICFTGGSDVTPELYGEDNSKRISSPNPTRDISDIYYWTKAQKHNIPTIGICRGAQFLNVMNGGKLWQDIDNHQTPHSIITFDDVVLNNVTSMHHQQMIPTDDAEWLAWANVSTYRHGKWGKQTITDLAKDYGEEAPKHLVNDAEIIFYPESKSLCFQNHPELGGYEERDYCINLMHQKVLDD